MKDRVNLNDVRRMRLLFGAGDTVAQVSERLKIFPSVVERWRLELAKPEAPPPAPAPVSEVKAVPPVVRKKGKRDGEQGRPL